VKPAIDAILDILQAHYGPQTPVAPTEPFRFLVWWHCGYPPSEERCALGWRALSDALTVTPQALSQGRVATLTRVLAAGGLVPSLRARRIKEIATAVRGEYGGNLLAALHRLPTAAACRLLRGLPGIGAPGAERILLFAGLEPLAAVPSGCPYVLTRILSGREGGYRATYLEAQRALEAALPATVAARQRAYLLLLRHGRALCRRSRPQCERCPLARCCRFNLAADRRKSAPRSHR
jgi:endonuclease III